MDRNRFNFQRMNEIAAVFSTMADREIPESYVIISNNYTYALQYVSTMDTNVDHEFTLSFILFVRDERLV